MEKNKYFEQLNRKANLDQIEQEYFDKLIAEYNEICGGRTEDEIKADKSLSGEEKLEILKQMARKLQEILTFLETENMKIISEITGISPEGKEIHFELSEQAKHWNKFYKKNSVDWVEPISENIKITEAQEKEMKRLITELGFNKMLIIPDNLVGQPEFEEYEEVDKKTGKKEIKKRLIKPAEHYEKLHELMSKGYENKTYQSDNYKGDGGFGGSQDSRTGFRIILTKEVQNLEDDELFKQTLNRSVNDLESEGGIFQEKGVSGLTEAEYLILQRDYQENNTGKHLDEKSWTWLPASRRPLLGRVPYTDWHPDYDRLLFGSALLAYRFDNLGCRLAGNFKL